MVLSNHWATTLSYTDRDHLNWGSGIVILGWYLRNLFNEVVPFSDLMFWTETNRRVSKTNRSGYMWWVKYRYRYWSTRMQTYLSEDWVGTFGTLVEPIQESVRIHIDEELRTATFWLTCVGHRQCTRCVGDLLMWLTDFIRDTARSITSVFLAVTRLELRSGIGTTSSCTLGVGVLSVGATKLVHEVGDNSMEVLWIDQSRKQKIFVSEIYSARFAFRCWGLTMPS